MYHQQQQHRNINTCLSLQYQHTQTGQPCKGPRKKQHCANLPERQAFKNQWYAASSMKQLYSLLRTMKLETEWRVPPASSHSHCTGKYVTLEASARGVHLTVTEPVSEGSRKKSKPASKNTRSLQVQVADCFEKSIYTNWQWSKGLVMVHTSTIIELDFATTLDRHPSTIINTHKWCNTSLFG